MNDERRGAILDANNRCVNQADREAHGSHKVAHSAVLGADSWRMRRRRQAGHPRNAPDMAGRRLEQATP